MAETPNVSFIIGEDGSIGQSEIVDPNEQYQPVKVNKLSPFDFVNAINQTKAEMFEVDSFTHERATRSDSEYPKFLINRAMSYFADTIMFANAANMMLSNVPNSSHFDFYRYGVSRKKRFSKWAKPINDETINMLCDYYQINIPNAIEVAQTLTEEQLNNLRQKMNHGGRTTTKTKRSV